MGRLTFEPLIPASLWLLLAVATTVLLAWYGASRPGRMSARSWFLILALMAAGPVLVLLVLLNPTWINPIDSPAGKPLLTILVDESASMAVKDAAKGQSRFDAARDIAGSLRSDLAARFDVRVRSFSTQLAPADNAEPKGKEPKGLLTDVAGAVSGSIENDRPVGQAVVILSDGIHNASGGTREVMNAVRSARAANTPIYTCTTGRQDTPETHDLKAEVRAPQQLAYVGQQIPIAVRVSERRGPGGTIEVSLFDEGKPVDKQTVALSAAGTGEAKFTVSRDAPGLYRYEARVEPRPGELITINNTSVAFLEVVNEPIRVLLLEGKPYWDSKFLMRTLAADPVIALDSVVRMAEGRFLRRALGNVPTTAPASSPTRDERWTVIGDPAGVLADAGRLDQYQIVVLGRDTESFLTAAAVTNLRKWISRQGGALVCYRGSPAVAMGQQLAQILPVEWTPGSESRYHVSLTEQGESLRWLDDLNDRLEGGTLAELPSLATAVRVEKPRPMATVLATARSPGGREDWPVITSQNYGTGRVVAIEGIGMWRWAFLPPQNQQHATVYGTLWQSLMRWLVSGTRLRPGQKINLLCDNVIFESSEPASATLLMADQAIGAAVPSVELRIVGEENAIGSFAPTASGDDPGVFRVSFGRLPPGQYEARLTNGSSDKNSGPKDLTTRFDVRAPVREQLDLAARPDLMRLMADESGGAELKSGSAREVLGAFESFQQRARPERVRRLPAWDRWYVLLGIFGVWAGAWAVRRAGGLI